MDQNKKIEALKVDIISLIPIQHQEDAEAKLEDLINAVEARSEVRILNSPFKLIDWKNVKHPTDEEE